jgi:hypothetical protein
MFFLAGAAASSALDLLSAVQQTIAAKVPAAGGQGFDPGPGQGAAPANAPTSPTGPPLTPGTMNALLFAQGQPGLVNGDAFSSQLFSLLDSNRDGSISKQEFEATFGQNGKTARADDIFARLDVDGDGAVSASELTSALQKGGEAHRQHGHHHDVGGAGGTSASGGVGNPPSSNDPLTQSDTSQTVTNADGSSTTTITYADGSQVSMTTPATASGADLHHSLERLIQRQAQMLSTSSAGQALTMSV